MKVRYTATARRELSEAVDYLLEQAPTVAGDFADSIEYAIAELLRH
jgi:plasmid stabilization system protein ParE